MDAKTDENHGAVAGQVERSVRPANAVKPGFGEWKAQVDKIAEAEGLTPKEHPIPGELDVWVKHFNAGKTPAQAWQAVPYKRRG